MASDRLAAALAVFDAAREVLAAMVDEAPTVEASTVQPPLLLKFDQAAELGGLSRTAIFEKVRSGDIPAVDVPGAGRRIRLADLETWIAGLGSK